MRETPRLTKLKFSRVKSLPKVEQHQPALVGYSVQSIADRVFVNLNDAASQANGISFHQSAHDQLENSRIRVLFVICSRVCQNDSPTTSVAPDLFFVMTRSALHQKPFTEWHFIIPDSTVGAMEGFPIHHFLSLCEHSGPMQGYEKCS
jgi:hypothetical protein